NQMVDGIMGAFPNTPIKEAEALAWGGLNEDFYGNPITSTWINLKNVSPTLANQIQVINSNYANGSDGTACP
ncbi:MAG: hypothetical protein K9I02_05335, partial [Haliscomenobacter sp.]|nr:hypothetical protein [Haliscomenobacter sp.]